MSMTALNPGPTLPAMITSPPTAQFTPGPGCVDPENHWVVYNFNVDGYFTGGYLQFTTERDGVSYDVGYPLPACATSYISELAGKEIAVQTQLNTHGWEKRQIANVPWDYLDGTMYAEVQSYDYTVFHGTHTCYQDCYGWRDYYFSGSVQPPFTVIDTPPVTTTPAEETSLLEGPSSAAGSAGIAETSPMPTGTQASPSPTGEDSSPVVSAVPPTPTPTSGGSDGDVSSPSSSPPLSTSAGESMGTVTVAVPVYLVSLALFMSSMVL
ncbi:hypothetical protein SAMD00023353_1400130 [Rosellinia necatrix]|uniref:Uncharacterized protein n=1 Tax=Rosellinia necatrix TaxID=77044 RepID=A0A1W2TCQ6_ROSNE|nr:hypothetical protein SAMD00023353_1400130 [Rosellinia necatrix]